MNILVTTGVYYPEIGGPATYTKLLEKELPKKGISVDVLPYRVVSGWPKGLKHLLFFFRSLKAGKKADIFYAQDPVSVGLPTLLASKVLAKPFLIRMPGDYAWEQSRQRFGVNDDIDLFQNKKYGLRVELLRALQKFVIRRADLIIAPSDYFRDLVASWLEDGKKVIRIYNGIDPPQPVDQERIAKTLISAGRLVPWKGFDFLIRLMLSLPDWSLEIAGDGPEKEKLEKLIRQEGLSNRVKLLGRIDRRSLMEKISRANIFLLNTHFESFSFQLVEAMALKTPVIATKIGNLSEIVESGKEGFLLNPNDSQAWLETIQILSEDKERTRELVSKAWQKAQNFSIGNSVDQLAKELKKLGK